MTLVRQKIQFHAIPIWSALEQKSSTWNTLAGTLWGSNPEAQALSALLAKEGTWKTARADLAFQKADSEAWLSHGFFGFHLENQRLQPLYYPSRIYRWYRKLNYMSLDLELLLEQSAWSLNESPCAPPPQIVPTSSPAQTASNAANTFVCTIRKKLANPGRNIPIDFGAMLEVVLSSASMNHSSYLPAWAAGSGSIPFNTCSINEQAPMWLWLWVKNQSKTRKCCFFSFTKRVFYLLIFRPTAISSVDEPCQIQCTQRDVQQKIQETAVWDQHLNYVLAKGLIPWFLHCQQSGWATLRASRRYRTSQGIQTLFEELSIPGQGASWRLQDSRQSIMKRTPISYVAQSFGRVHLFLCLPSCLFLCGNWSIVYLWTFAWKPTFL